MKTSRMRFLFAIVLLLIFALQGCGPNSSDFDAEVKAKLNEIKLPKTTPLVPTPKLQTEKLQTEQLPTETPEILAEDLFRVFLKKQQIGEVGCFSIPYSFATPYDDDYVMVMPGAVDLEEAIYSAQIADIDADGEVELLVVRSAAVSADWNADEHVEAFHIDVYEVIDGQVTLADTVQLGTNTVPTSAFRGFSDVFFKEAKDGWFIGLDSFNMAHYYADGISWGILLYKYDGASLYKVFETSAMGSSFEGEFDTIRKEFNELMEFGFFPDGTPPYISDDEELDYHRITIEGLNIPCLLRLESWNIYESWDTFNDLVDESVKQEKILVDDDLYLVTDESDLAQYIGSDSRKVIVE